MEKPSFYDLSASTYEFNDPLTSTSDHELHFHIMGMVQDRRFFGAINEDPYFHLEELEELFASGEGTFVPGGGSNRYKCLTFVPGGGSTWYKCVGLTFILGGATTRYKCEAICTRGQLPLVQMCCVITLRP
jgi:hypothetical protein